MIRRFARPYARAIMDVTAAPDRAAALLEELKRFEQARKGSADLQALYANPAQDTASKLNVTRAIAERLGASELAVKVLEVLIRNHRINDLAAIDEALAEMIRQATGTVAAEVRSAQQPTPAELDELRRTLEKKVGRKVEVDVTVDPALLGGFVAKIGSEIYDASVAGKIHKFRESLG
jgi:F-type H+-transporting ATPase subunit delta